MPMIGCQTCRRRFHTPESHPQETRCGRCRRATPDLSHEDIEALFQTAVRRSRRERTFQADLGRDYRWCYQEPR